MSKPCIQLRVQEVFGKKNGDAQMVRITYATPEAVSTIIKVIGVQKEKLREEVVKLKDLYNQSQEACPPVIEPICTLTKEAFYNEN